MNNINDINIYSKLNKYILGYLIYISAKNNNVFVTSLLNKFNYFDYEYKNGLLNHSALMNACIHGNYNMVSILLNKNNVNDIDDFLTTPLSLCIQNFDNDFNVTIYTPTIIRKIYDRIIIIKLLLNHGADFRCDSNKINPLMYFIDKFNNNNNNIHLPIYLYIFKYIFKILNNKLINDNINIILDRDTNGHTIFNYIFNNNNYFILTLLLKYIISLDINLTPIYLPACYKKPSNPKYYKFFIIVKNLYENNYSNIFNDIYNI